MTVFKDQQRDKPKFSLLDWLRGLFFKLPCPSYIVYNGDMHVCHLRKRHAGRHQDNITKLKWGYGDDYLGTPQHERALYEAKHGEALSKLEKEFDTL